jgi:hypothetical protein
VLNELDEILSFQKYRTLSLISAGLWIVTLLTTPARKVVTLCSVISIVAAFFVAPFIPPRSLEMNMIYIFLLVLLVATMRNPSSIKDMLRGVAFFAFTVGIRSVAASTLKDVSDPSKEMMTIKIIAIAMCAVSLLPKPVKPIVVTGLISIRAFGEVYDSNLCLYLGAAFCAQLAQGIAHDFTKQKATLFMNEDSGVTRSTRLAFDWSHCVYFPNLLFQSCYDSIRLGMNLKMK